MSAVQPEPSGQKQVAEKQIQEVSAMSNFIHVFEFIFSFTASFIYPAMLQILLFFKCFCSFTHLNRSVQIQETFF